MKTFFFVSGLPRAGSTLLSTILRQNPQIYAGVTSPAAPLFNTMLGQFTPDCDAGQPISPVIRRALLRGVLQNFYEGLTDRPFIFDTHRVWCARIPVLIDIFPDTKIIACVRNLAWIMDSIERNLQQNPLQNSRLFLTDAERDTVYSRCDALAQRSRMVGFSWHATKEAYFGTHRARLLIVDYENLARTPAREIKRIYDFLGLPYFRHKFTELTFCSPDLDKFLGLPEFHTVRPAVKFRKRPTILPPDLFDKYSDLSFWKNS